MDYQTMIDRYQNEKAKADECHALAQTKSQADAEYWEYMQMYCMHKAAMASAIKAADYYYQHGNDATISLNEEPKPE